jgi:hypothetical protein
VDRLRPDEQFAAEVLASRLGLYALGEPSPVVMAELGHTDPAPALRLYAQAMRRDGDDEALKALVEGAQMAVIGSRAPQSDEEVKLPDAA